MSPSSTPTPTLTGAPLIAARVAVAGLWLWGLSGFFFDFPTADYGRIAVVALAGIHVIEMFFLVPMLKRRGLGTTPHLLPLFLQGSVHYLAVASLGEPA